MIRVMVVDDSALMRRMLQDLLPRTKGIEVVAACASGRIALDRLAEVKPDVVTLDVDMPGMDGVEVVEEIMASPTACPIVMFSSLTARGAEVTLAALDAGALDYVTKPAGRLGALDLQKPMEEIVAELALRIRAVAGRKVRRRAKGSSTAVASPPPKVAARPGVAPPLSAIHGAGGRAGASVLGGDRMSQIAEGTAWPPAAAPPLSAIHGAGGTAWPPAAASPPGVFVGLGISTGGPPALMKLLAALGPGTPPMAIVQHMPEGFVPSFTARLNAASALEVVVAKDDMVIPAGVCVVAPGDRHLEIVRRGDLYRARLRDGEKVSGHRPSADLLLRSIAESAGEKGLGVLMTGMGRDGADGMAAIKRAGGRTIAQDQESSVVYGMPRAAVEEGNADRILPLEEIAGGIMTAFRK
jgi:two-component system chemotaxis response regulator CheB